MMITLVRAQKHRHSSELCPCLGLGRYLYYFTGVWVDIDDRKRPKKIPTLPEWATPDGWRKGLRPRIMIRIHNRATRTRLAAHLPTIIVGTEQQPRRKAPWSDRLRLWWAAWKGPISRLAKVSGTSLESEPDSGYGSPAAGIRAHAGGRTRLAASEISLGESRGRASTEHSQFASSCFSRKSGQPRNIEADCVGARSASVSKLIPATNLPTFPNPHSSQ